MENRGIPDMVLLFRESLFGRLPIADDLNSGMRA
jgi:hypothetical protein